MTDVFGKWWDTIDKVYIDSVEKKSVTWPIEILIWDYMQYTVHWEDTLSMWDTNSKYDYVWNYENTKFCKTILKLKWKGKYALNLDTFPDLGIT